jgi:hypothetical protein
MDALLNVRVFATPGQRSPAGWAEIAVKKVIEVADTAPQPIRDQAHAFRAAIERVFANYIRMALDEERAYIARELEGTGRGDLAMWVKQRGI